jgi:RHS repeat-associated protein
VTGLTYPDNDAIGYRYNDRSLLQTITGGPTGSIVSNLVYIPSDQQREILYGNGIRTAYAYDERLRLQNLNTAPRANPGSPFIAFDYAFDGVSNIRSITDQRPGTVVPEGDKRRNTQLFQYDDLYRLTRVQYSFALPGAAPVNNGEVNYRYDRIGNMLAQTSTLDHVEKGLPVANLGEMDSGGMAGRWNRVGRTANDPPGPHALTSIRHAKVPTRKYPYDANGNMTDLDGMVATWDFKDRLVALEDATMRAEYVYDFTDRRITKRVTKKTQATPAAVTDPGKGVTSSFTTTYVGKHFEVREFDAPTKFIFNGDTRIARVTGTLSPNQRVQRLRVYSGWNLLSVAVTADRGGAQLAATGLTESMYRWNPVTRAFAVLNPTETVAAGSVLWVKAIDTGTLRVSGVYPGPKPNPRGLPEGDFLAGHGLEAWPMDALVAHPSLAMWRFAPDLQNWQTKLPLPNLKFSDLPAVLAPHEAVFAKAPASAELESPDPALSMRFYHQDHLGSSSVISDGVGGLVEEAANYPFGSSRSEFKPRGLRGDYQFTQKERDFESALDYFEARFLVSNFGRFNRVDPLARDISAAVISVPQRLNTYAYALVNPVRFVDPTGLFDKDLALDGVFSIASSVAVGALSVGVAVAAAPVGLTVGAAVSVTAGIFVSGAALGYGIARLSGGVVLEGGSKESARLKKGVAKAESITDRMADAVDPTAWPGHLAKMAVLDGATGGGTVKEASLVKDVVDGLVSVRGLVRGKFDARDAQGLLKAAKSFVENVSPETGKPTMQSPVVLRREASRDSLPVSGNEAVEVPKLIEARRVSY